MLVRTYKKAKDFDLMEVFETGEKLVTFHRQVQQHHHPVHMKLEISSEIEPN